MAEAAELSNDWTVLDQKFKTFNRLMTTKAAIGQTPKETELGRSTRPNFTGTFLLFQPRSDIRYR